MKIIYYLLSFIFHYFAKIFLIYRVFKKKEDPKRYLEKIGKYKIKNTKPVIWFHASSLGEIKSIIPIIFYYEKKIKKKILKTKFTLISANYCKEILVGHNQIIHQFAPLDTPIIVKKFLDHWKPAVSIFVESELWPNLIFESKKKSKLILINARLSKKTFQKWKSIKNYAKEIFCQFNLIIAQSRETKIFLNYFNIKKIKYLGNLKFCENTKTISKFKKLNRNEIPKWVAISTHDGEEQFIINTIKLIKRKKIQSQCILIPRHIHRIKKIITLIKKNNLIYELQSKKSKKNIPSDLFVVDSYGQANKFLEKTNAVLIGGTIINHGGQNPLEAARLGCNIFNGPFTHNFTEIFNFLKKNKISKLIKNEDQLSDQLTRKFKKLNRQSVIKKIIKKKGQKILLDHINYLNPYIN